MDKPEITFERLPAAVAQLLDEVSQIKRLLTEKDNNNEPRADHLLTVEQAAQLLHLTVPTVYGLVHRKEVPVCKKGKRLYFSRDELTAYIRTGRKKTVTELTIEAENEFRHLNKKK